MSQKNIHRLYISIAGNSYAVITENEFIADNLGEECVFIRKRPQDSKTVNFDVEIKKLSFNPADSSKKNLSVSRYFTFVFTALFENETIPHGVIFLHGSSVIHNNKGYLFIGASGTGKSTMANKFPAETRLSDETAVVRKINGAFYLYSSPFEGKKIRFNPQKKVRLDTIFLLSQAGVNELIPMEFEDRFYALLNNDYSVMNKRNFVRNGIILSNSSKIYGLLLNLAVSVEMKKFLNTKNADPRKVVPQETIYRLKR